jgi:hypothetical protein
MKACLAAAVVLAGLSSLPAAETGRHPVKVSANGRYFVDRTGQPLFWLGTTQWQLFRDNTSEEAREIIESSKAKGFTFIQAMLLGVGDGTKANAVGERPWASTDPLVPNESYFRNVDLVLRAARENDVAISLTLYHQRWRKLITAANARGWAKWLAGRYKDVPTIVWSMTPEAKEEFVPVLRELAVGLREGDGGAHLITFKPDPAPFSSSFIHGEPWLDFDSMQVWNRLDLIRPFIAKDYGMKPAKPVLMAEGAYEAGTEYGFDVTPLWVRRQAYSSYLSGAHFTYGHNESWRMLPTWRKSLDAPGAVQMGVLKKVFLGLPEWWRLVPDPSVLASGGVTDGKVLRLAARHEEGAWVLVYLAEKATVKVDIGEVVEHWIDPASGETVPARATWIDPRNGEKLPAGTFSEGSAKPFATPEGWEDALLLFLPVAGGKI